MAKAEVKVRIVTPDPCPECGGLVRFTNSDECAHCWFINREITHRCPPEGSGVMPCCGRTPFEVSRSHRLTVHDELVTCRFGREVIPVQEASDG